MVAIIWMVFHQIPLPKKGSNLRSEFYDLLVTMIKKSAYSSWFKDPIEELWKHDINIEK